MCINSAFLFLNYNPLRVDSMKCKYCSAQSPIRSFVSFPFFIPAAFVTSPGGCCGYLDQEDWLPKCVHCLVSPSIASCPTLMLLSLGVQSGIFCVLICISSLTNEIELFINRYYFLCFEISCLHPY